LYRTSTQYRLWSFTPEKLLSLRANTNDLAADHVKAAIKRHRQTKSHLSSLDVSATTSAATSDAENNPVSNGPGGPVRSPPTEEIDCLTAEEEKKLIDFYCTSCLQMSLGDPFGFPIHVVVRDALKYVHCRFLIRVQATAIQFLKRFYLSNSPMTYQPKKIMPSALFLATKTEAIHLQLKDFVVQMKTVPGMKKITEEEVLAPEFIITQGLRFAFDIHHPFRALKGAFLELLLFVNVAKGGKSPAWISTPAETLSRQLLDLPKADGSTSGRRTIPLEFEKRVKAAYEAAKKRLESDAIISDAYFLYTPSQIMFATLWLADQPLTEFYLSTKINTGAKSLGGKPKILATIKDCAMLLKEYASQSGTLYEEAVAIDKKLHLCRNPEKLDLVKLNAAQKRDAGEEGKLDDKVAKKRKLEREHNAKDSDDLFGPDIPKAKEKD